MSFQKIALYLLFTLFCQQGIAQGNPIFKNLNTDERIEKYNKLSSERKELIGKQVPKFEGVDLVTGEVISDRLLQGKLTVLNFNVTSGYNTPAKFQHEQLNILHSKLDTSQVQIISINTNEKEIIHKNIDIEDGKIPIVILSKDDVETLFKINTSPINLIIDENGIIRMILKNSSWVILEEEVRRL